ncbi:hypothetical protein BMMON2_09620 [Burkholderia mallei]
MAVPVHHRDGRVRADAERRERAGKPTDALAKLRIRMAHVAAIDDLSASVGTARVRQQLPDEQRIDVGRRAAFKAEC